MGLYTVKSAIRNYVNSQIYIDEWGLKAPINIPKIIDGVYYPSVAAIVIPVQGFSMANDSLVLVNAQAEFGIDIAWRFNGQAAFRELPIDILENLIDWVSHHPINRPGLFSDLVYECSVEENENPVMVSRTDTEDRDWVLYGMLRWNVSFRDKPIHPNDLGVIQPDLDRSQSIIVTSVGVRTWKEIQDATLDKELFTS